LKDVAIEVAPDGRRVLVGFDLTPFRERPSLDVVIVNKNDEVAGNLTVIETIAHQFSLIIHLRDKKPTDQYDVFTEVFFTGEPGDPRQIVDRHQTQFTIPDPEVT
jgi:hypothetical protein